MDKFLLNQRISRNISRFSTLPIEIIEILLCHIDCCTGNAREVLKMLAYTHPLMYVRIEHALYNLIRLKYNRDFRCEQRMTIPKLIKMYTLTSIDVGYSFLPRNIHITIISCVFNKRNGIIFERHGKYRKRKDIMAYSYMAIDETCISPDVIAYYANDYCFQATTYNYYNKCLNIRNRRTFWDHVILN